MSTFPETQRLKRNRRRKNNDESHVNEKEVTRFTCGTKTEARDGASVEPMLIWS